MRWLDIYTVLGGTFGIVAFFQSLYKGVAATNKSKWAALVPGVINERDLELLAKPSTAFFTVDSRLRSELLKLNNKLNERGDAFRFRVLFRDPYKQHLLVLEEVTASMRTRFKEEWQEQPYPVGGGSLLSLNRSYFESKFGSEGADKAMLSVGRALTQDLTRLLTAIEAIRELANREDADYLMPWKYRKHL